MTSDPGYRIASHTADLMIEAWGPTRARCFEHAARGLVASFAEVQAGAAGEPHLLDVAEDDDAAMLVSLLEEIVYLLDARGAVGLARAVEERPGGVRAVFELLPAERVAFVGALPKAIAYHELAVHADEDRWRCRVTVDV